MEFFIIFSIFLDYEQNRALLQCTVTETVHCIRAVLLINH